MTPPFGGAALRRRDDLSLIASRLPLDDRESRGVTHRTPAPLRAGTFR